MNKKYKFVHILWHNDTKFYPGFVKMINDEQTFFTASDHLFITPHNKVMENLPYDNVILVDDTNLINKYGKYADWIFVHSLDCQRLHFLFTKKKYAKKVIWRTWGHDVVSINMKPIRVYPKEWVKYYAKKMIESLRHRVIKNFHAVGVANNVDVLKIKKQFGHMRTFNIPYEYDPSRLDLLEEVKSNISCRPYTRIMVGHSSWASENHMLALEKLSKFKCENIIICLLFAYGGDKHYTDSVKNKAMNIFGNKVEIVDKFIPYDKYVEFLTMVDVAVFASEKSTALGNISLLSYFHKKIYVFDGGDLAMGFREAGCVAHSLNDIGSESFSEFKTYLGSESEKMKQVYGDIKTSKQICESMKAIFDELTNFKKFKKQKT